MTRMPLFTGAALLALMACSSPSVYRQYYASGYDPSHVGLASIRETLAVIRNNPFPENRGAVLAAMHGQNFGPKLRYAQVPWPDDPYGYKVVMTFNGPFTETNFCNATESTAAPPPQSSGPRRIDVLAAFCVGNVLLSEAAGSATGVTGPDDPKFRRLIGGVLYDLLPPYNPNRRDDDCRIPPC